MERLTELVLDAGHRDFRDARGPLGLTQRQAGGKFTGDEADDLIAQLEAELEGSEETAPAERPPRPDPKQARALAAARKLPTEALAAELQRRGWIVCEP